MRARCFLTKPLRSRLAFATIAAFAMASDDRTDRFRPVFEPEEIFDQFVKKANASGEARAKREDEPTGVIEGGQRKTIRPPALRAAKETKRQRPAWDHAVTVRVSPDAMPDPDGTQPAAPVPLAMSRAFEGAPRKRESRGGSNVVLLTKVKRPAKSEPLVPDVGVTRSEPAPVREGGEDGQIPPRELDSLLSDMAVLLRYGHAGQVRERLEQLRRAHPEDLLLLRRIAEFHVEHDDREAALEVLFALAGGLFERRNVEGMREALRQVQVLDPDNPRARRLLALLEQRPAPK